MNRPVKWLAEGITKESSLPDEFRLGLAGTLKDAKRVAMAALYSGDKSATLVPFETAFQGQLKALKELSARPTISEKFQWVINDTLDRKDGQGIKDW